MSDEPPAVVTCIGPILTVSEGTLPEPSIINCSAIVMLKKSELEDFIETIDDQTIQGVDDALSITLGLESWLQRRENRDPQRYQVAVS